MAWIDYKHYKAERDRADAAEKALVAEHELYKDMRQKYLAEKQNVEILEKSLDELEELHNPREFR